MIQQQISSQKQKVNNFAPKNRIQALLIRGFKAGALAVIVNSFIYLVAQGFNGGLLIQQGSQLEVIALAAVLAFSFFPSIVATILYWLLERFTKYPKTIFLVTSAMVFTSFFFGPVGTAVDSFSLWALELMHLGAALPIIVGLLNASYQSIKTKL